MIWDGEGGLHLRVEDGGRRINNTGRTTVGLHLIDLASGSVGDDSRKDEVDVLGHHVEDKLVWQLVLLAGGHLDTVPDGRQVAYDRGVVRRILGQRLGGLEDATNKGHVNGDIFVVCDLDDGFGRPPVDQLHAEDVGIREGRVDADLKLVRRHLLQDTGLGISLERPRVSN